MEEGKGDRHGEGCLQAGKGGGSQAWLAREAQARAQLIRMGKMPQRIEAPRGLLKRARLRLEWLPSIHYFPARSLAVSRAASRCSILSKCWSISAIAASGRSIKRCCSTSHSWRRISATRSLPAEVR